MIFKATSNKEFEQIATCSIIEHTDLNEFLLGQVVGKQILTCPTNAIDTDKREITKNCIDCGICWIKYPYLINKTKNAPSPIIFKDYLRKNKMFIYKWLALCIDNLVGINIKSKGFSRVKRIPLVIKSKNRLYFIKAVYEVADFEKADYELEDTIQLIKEDFSQYQIKKIIVTIEGINQSIKNKSAAMDFEELYEKVINNNKRRIEEIID